MRRRRVADRPSHGDGVQRGLHGRRERGVFARAHDRREIRVGVRVGRNRRRAAANGAADNDAERADRGRVFGGHECEHELSP